MEALIYDDSPLAEYLEGDAEPADKPANEPIEILSNRPQYAPRGFPKLHEQLQVLRSTARTVAQRADQDFLEQFRYQIIASQLLSDDGKSRIHKTKEEESNAFAPTTFTSNGAYIATGVSFAIAWVLNWLRCRIRTASQNSWLEICACIAIVGVVIASLVLVARQQYVKFIRKATIVSLANLIAQSHGFDTATSAIFRYIQEIEVVARGYTLSSPLPPVSRLEDTQVTKRCRYLRSITANQLRATIAQFSDAHDCVRGWINSGDLASYYHIYETSLQECSEALILLDGMAHGGETTLKELRLLFETHIMIRKLFLIDLLALQTKMTTFSDILQWRNVSQTILLLAEESEKARDHLKRTMMMEEEYAEREYDSTVGQDKMHASTQEMQSAAEKPRLDAQIRRLDDVSNGVRSLNAKMRLCREDLSEMIAADSSAAEIANTILRNYDYLGSELKSLLVEWERGRNTMLLNMSSGTKSSRSSSAALSSISPSPSLGGLTVVEGGPADALRLLNNEDDHVSFDDTGYEEVFEAVAQPRKRMSMALTRNEKMAKLAEDRKKRATLQEQADTTTTMLRELRMVIKHRPENGSTKRLLSI